MHAYHKRALVLFFIVAFLASAGAQTAAAQSSSPAWDPHGPYVDKIIYKVITGQSQQIIALKSGEIDMIGDMVDPNNVPYLQEDPEIDLAYTFRNGYGYVTINTAKYPLNYTVLRRAIAFAVDKQAVSQEIWSGLSVPLDSCVPKANPYSVEDELPYHYYEANIELANQMLDNAGFTRVTGDTSPDGTAMPNGFYRKTPNGTVIKTIIVEAAQSSDIAMGVAQYIADAMLKIGIPAKMQATDFYEYLQRLQYHGDYDMTFLGVSFGSFDVDWLAYEFASDYADKPFYNFPNWRNATYDSYIPILLHSTNATEVMNAAKKMQEIWVHACPEIVMYENTLVSAYRTNKFEGFINDVSHGAPNYWTNMKVHLKSTGGTIPTGGTFIWSNPKDIDTFNPFTTNSAYASNVLMMLYDSLITLDWNGEDRPWLAESWEATSIKNTTKFTFHLIHNATWSNGDPITADDVVFSINYVKTTPGGADLANLINITAVDDYTVVAYFQGESFWYLHSIGFKSIIPRMLWEGKAYNEVNIEDPTNWVYSGPFTVNHYVRGEYVELVYRPGYWYGVEHTGAAPAAPTGGNMFIGIAAIGAAAVILIGGYIFLKKQ